MTYSQLLYRMVVLGIALAAGWLLVTDRLCFLSTAGDCRPAQGLSGCAIPVRTGARSLPGDCSHRCVPYLSDLLLGRILPQPSRSP